MKYCKNKQMGEFSRQKNCKFDWRCILWKWASPTENCEISGMSLRTSSVTRWTPRCCGLRLIFLWNQAEPIWIPLELRLDPGPPPVLSSQLIWKRGFVFVCLFCFHSLSCQMNSAKHNTSIINLENGKDNSPEHSPVNWMFVSRIKQAAC